MGGATMLDAYETAIKAENLLIQGRRLAPRPPMPLFPNLPSQQPIVAPSPEFSSSQPLFSLKASTSSSKYGELKSMMQAVMKNVDKVKDQGTNIERRLQDQSLVV